MKFKISMPAMKHAAKLTAPFAADSKDLAELRCLKIHACEDVGLGPYLSITAFNRTAWVHLMVAGAEIERAGICLVDAEAFRRWVAAGSDVQPLEIDVVGTNANLKVGSATCKMPTLDVAKYADPTYSASAGHTTAVLPAKELIRGVGAVSFATDKANTAKQRTDVVYFDIDNTGLNLVATDGKAMSAMLLSANVDGDPISQSVPQDSVRLLTPLLEAVGDAAADVKINRYECLVETERFKFGSRLIDAKQFPWRKLMAKCEETKGERIKVPTKELIAAIRQVLAADPSEFRLRIATEGDGLYVGIPNKAETTVPLDDVPAPMSFWCQPEFLTDMLNVVARHDLPLTMEWGIYGPIHKIVMFRAGTDWRYTLTPLVDPVLETPR